MRACMLFAITFGAGLAFYMPINAAAMRLVPAYTALCTASLEGFGYGCALLVQLAVAPLLRHGGWRLVWAFLCALNLVAFVAMRSFLLAVQQAEQGGLDRAREAEGVAVGSQIPSAAEEEVPLIAKRGRVA